MTVNLGESGKWIRDLASDYGVSDWQMRKIGARRFEAMAENGRQLFASLMRNETRGRGGHKLQAGKKASRAC